VKVKTPAKKHRKKKRRRRRHHAGSRSPAFTGKVRAAAKTRKVWRAVDSDLGLAIMWRVDANGVYIAEWEVPLDAATGRYRFVVHANHYGLTSQAFTVKPSGALTAVPVNAGAGRVGVELDYPAADAHQGVGDPPGDYTADLTDRPAAAASGLATFVVDGRAVTVSENGDGVFTVPAPAGAAVTVKAGGVRDEHGNANGNELTLSP
jgi:hypothetical protein